MTQPAIAIAGGAKLGVLAKGRMAVTVGCAAACAVSADLRIGGKVVAAGRTTLLAAGTAKARLKPSAKALRTLKRLKSARATLRVTVRSAAGTATHSKALRLKR